MLALEPLEVKIYDFLVTKVARVVFSEDKVSDLEEKERSLAKRSMISLKPIPIKRVSGKQTAEIELDCANIKMELSDSEESIEKD